MAGEVLLRRLIVLGRDCHVLNMRTISLSSYNRGGLFILVTTVCVCDGLSFIRGFSSFTLYLEVPLYYLLLLHLAQF